MKKTKIKERLENAVEAFFDNEKLSENTALAFSTSAKISQNQFFNNLSEKGDWLVKVLKQVFIFFPGTLLLFEASFLSSFVTVINPYNTVSLSNPLMMFLFSLVAALMVWFGIGDLRKPKHLIIPISIVGLGFLSGSAVAIITVLFNLYEKVFPNNYIPLFFLPLALTVPFLAKALVDKTDDEKLGV